MNNFKNNLYGNHKEALARFFEKQAASAAETSEKRYAAAMKKSRANFSRKLAAKKRLADAATAAERVNAERAYKNAQAAVAAADKEAREAADAARAARRAADKAGKKASLYATAPTVSTTATTTTSSETGVTAATVNNQLVIDKLVNLTTVGQETDGGARVVPLGFNGDTTAAEALGKAFKASLDAIGGGVEAAIAALAEQAVLSTVPALSSLFVSEAEKAAAGLNVLFGAAAAEQAAATATGKKVDAFLSFVLNATTYAGWHVGQTQKDGEIRHFWVGIDKMPAYEEAANAASGWFETKLNAAKAGDAEAEEALLRFARRFGVWRRVSLAGEVYGGDARGKRLSAETIKRLAEKETLRLERGIFTADAATAAEEAEYLRLWQEEFANRLDAVFDKFLTAIAEEEFIENKNAVERKFDGPNSRFLKSLYEAVETKGELWLENQRAREALDGENERDAARVLSDVYQTSAPQASALCALVAMCHISEEMKHCFIVRDVANPLATAVPAVAKAFAAMSGFFGTLWLGCKLEKAYLKLSQGRAVNAAAEVTFVIKAAQAVLAEIENEIFASASLIDDYINTTADAGEAAAEGVMDSDVLIVSRRLLRQWLKALDGVTYSTVLDATSATLVTQGELLLAYADKEFTWANTKWTAEEAHKSIGQMDYFRYAHDEAYAEGIHRLMAAANAAVPAENRGDKPLFAITGGGKAATNVAAMALGRVHNLSKPMCRTIAAALTGGCMPGKGGRGIYSTMLGMEEFNATKAALADAGHDVSRFDSTMKFVFCAITGVDYEDYILNGGVDGAKEA